VERFQAFSAASQAIGVVNPLALETLAHVALPTAGCRSKGWEEFATPEAQRMDFAFTARDKAAGETCPAWPGPTCHSALGHARPSGSRTQSRRSPSSSRHGNPAQASHRVESMMALPLPSTDRISLQAAAHSIGQQS